MKRDHNVIFTEIGKTGKMPLKAVEVTENITLIGGGEVSKADFSWALARAPIVVAADGGANFAQIEGITPRAVIGDFDSISPETRAALPDAVLHPIPEQDSTDFDKCLRSVSAPLIIGVGFLGRRLDHQLAALNTLVAHAATPCLLVGGHDVAFVAPLDVTLNLPVGTRVSLFPMGPVTGHAEGLEWPLDGLNFAPDSRIGTSNRSTAPTVRLTFSDRKMVVILPRDAGDAALAALHDARDR